MLLSYSNRMLCLALCSSSLLLFSLETIAWQVVPYLLRHKYSASARVIERTIFLIALFARLSPWLVVLGAWVPAYMRGEDNMAPEYVGLFSLCTAAIALSLLAINICKSFKTWVGTQSYRNACRDSEVSFEGSPMLLHPGEQPILAVIGVFRPRLIVSKAFLAPGLYSTAALEAAFRHEAAHARQRDNLKMIGLSLLPHVPIGSTERPSLNRQWRLAAEIAADEEGTMGNQNGSILLAELLVSVAKARQQCVPHGASGLLASGDDLQIRVDRLLSIRNASVSEPPGQGCRCIEKAVVYAILTSLGLLAVLFLLSAKFGHSTAEALLHLG